MKGRQYRVNVTRTPDGEWHAATQYRPGPHAMWRPMPDVVGAGPTIEDALIALGHAAARVQQQVADILAVVGGK